MTMTGAKTHNASITTALGILKVTQAVLDRQWVILSRAQAVVADLIPVASEPKAEAEST